MEGVKKEGHALCCMVALVSSLLTLSCPAGAFAALACIMTHC